MQVGEENPSVEPAAFGCLKPLRYCLIWIALYELTLGLAAEIVSDYLLEPQSRDGYAALMALGGGLIDHAIRTSPFFRHPSRLETMVALFGARACHRCRDCPCTRGVRLTCARGSVTPLI